LKKLKEDMIFDTINNILMVIVCAVMLYPMLYVFGRSVMTPVERAARPFAFIPFDGLDMSGYEFILSSGSYILNAYMVTIGRAVIGTICNLIFTSMLAYVLSRRNYPLRLPLTAMVVFTMWFNGGLVPNYILIRSLGLTNRFLVYILPGLISAWNTLILRNFMMAIPDSMEESAKMDGASDIKILWKIIIPLSKPALAALGLFYAVGHWNSWFDALLYISNRKLWPIQNFLREIITNVSGVDLMDSNALFDKDMPVSETVKLSTIVISTVPILCVYPFLQKYFVKGIMVGSLKG